MLETVSPLDLTYIILYLVASIGSYIGWKLRPDIYGVLAVQTAFFISAWFAKNFLLGLFFSVL